MYLMVLGKPLFIWAGILSFVCMLIAGIGGMLRMRVKSHKWFAIAGILLAAFHVAGAFLS